MNKHMALGVLLVFLLPVIAGARWMARAWTYAKLRDASDLIVIATPAEVTATAERTPLPDITQLNGDGKRSDVIGAGVETTFKVHAVLKGDAVLKEFVLHHYQAGPETIGIDGPGLMSFDPKEKKDYLMFLKRERDGRFCPVSGQTDPDISVLHIGARLPEAWIWKQSDDKSVGAGGQTNPVDRTFIKATVTRVDTMEPHAQAVITNSTELTDLASFFGDIADEKKTDLAGGWEAKFKISFERSDGVLVKVATSHDDKDWSSGKGDKVLKPGLSRFLEPLFAKH